jgi:putative transposase
MTSFILSIDFSVSTSFILSPYIIFRVLDITLEVIAMKNPYEERMIAIRRYVEGETPFQIYTSLGRSPKWFFTWKRRYELSGLDGLKDLSRAPKRQAEQTDEAIETAIVNIRLLREQRERDETKYALIGAVAIQKELQTLGYTPPCVKTVHHILVRHGLISPKPAPQSVREVIDRHYPAVNVNVPGQVHQLDLVGPRYVCGSSQTYYFYNLRDVCSRRVAVEVGQNHQAQTICNALIRAWQRMGIPTMLQHDNALEFRGSNRYPRTAGLLTKLCIALQIESVFVPAREPYRNGTLENFNGLFQRLVLKTQHLKDFAHIQHEVSIFERVANTQHPHIPLHGQTSEDYEQSLTFTPKLLSPDFKMGRPFHVTPTGDSKVSFICRIRKSGKITIASEKFLIDPDLAWDYVYATICVKEQQLKIYHKGEIIKTFPYQLEL